MNLELEIEVQVGALHLEVISIIGHLTLSNAGVWGADPCAIKNSCVTFFFWLHYTACSPTRD